jgi:pimeloyl-ACP methyl ester carboxylesterase
MSLRHIAAIFLAGATLLAAGQSLAQPAKLGAIVMHGKGGSPASLVSELAAALEAKGFAVANLEMPWSGNRTYDVDTKQADRQVDAAIADLKTRGAGKVFVMGHSQGGVFALHYATRHPVDGVVAIAPGGSVDNQTFLQQVGASLSRAKQLVAEGRGAEKQRLDDFEGSRGNFTVVAPPAAYVTWFDPDGAMSMTRTLREFPATVPVLWVSPTGDYPGLRRSASQSYGRLPKNPLDRFVEPDTGHKGAPRAAIPAILEWTAQLAAGR